MKFNDETGPHQVAQLSASETDVPAMKFTYGTGDRPLDGYTIKRGIGSGGFGEVYYATSEGGKQVALKMVRRHLDVELRGVNQCLNLKHPNLVVLYDVKQGESGDCWVIMEYMSGESLAEVIARHPRGMPSDQAVAYLRGICEGVSHLHTHGIVHRDLKPGNVFTEDGSIKVGDYGLAKFMSVSRRSGQTESVGTVHYMAPELSQGRYGKEIDLYAVGIMLYEMLTGRVPFEGESAGEILMKHLTAEPDLSRLAEPYRSVIARALAKDPLLRYPSMQAMLEDLDTRLAMPAAAAPRWAAAPHAAQFQPILARHAAAWPAASLNKARALADRQLFKRFASLVARLLIAVFFGVGAGLLLGGISLRLLDDEISAAFAGAGAGTLTAAILLILLCGTVPGRHRVWPLLAALMLGVGCGLLAGGVVGSAGDRFELLAALAGSGVGSLTAGLAAYGLFTWFGVPLYWRWGLVVPLLAAGAGLSAGALGVFAGAGEVVVGMVAAGSGFLTLAILLCLFFFGRLAQRLNAQPALEPGKQPTEPAMGRAWSEFRAGTFDWALIYRHPLVVGMAVLAAVVATALAGASAVYFTASSDGSIPYIEEFGHSRAAVETVEWELHRFNGHTGPVACLAFGQDGSRLASGSGDSTIRIWNVSDSPGRETLIEQVGDAHQVAFSRDGTLLAASAGHEVSIWDANTAEKVAGAAQSGQVYAVAFSRNGDQVAAGGMDDVVRTFDARTGLAGRQFFGCSREIHALAYSPVADQLAAIGRHGDKIRIWNTSTGRQEVSLECIQWIEHLAFSPDGLELAAGGRHGDVRVWRLDRPGHRPRILHSACNGLSYGPAGHQLAVATRDTIDLWDTERGRLLCKFAGNLHRPTCVAFHPDGSRLASGGQDATIRVWEIPEHLRAAREGLETTAAAASGAAEAPLPLGTLPFETTPFETTIDPDPAGDSVPPESTTAQPDEAEQTDSVQGTPGDDVPGDDLPGDKDP